MKQRKRMKAKADRAYDAAQVRYWVCALIPALIERHGTLIYSTEPEWRGDFDAIRAAFDKIKAEVEI